MADFESRTISLTRHEYVLDSPTNAAEVSKAISAAGNEWRISNNAPGASVPDDVIKVSSRDDEIVIWWMEGD